jgi:lysophospholipase L1-like esterase
MIVRQIENYKTHTYRIYKKTASLMILSVITALAVLAALGKTAWALSKRYPQEVALAVRQPDPVEPESGRLARLAIAMPLADYPSFNSQRLDQQLRLYADHLATFGVPDVLIVGSSRALQGVDPVALQQALAEQEYPGLNVYNFSINGATAQVIKVLLQQILTPEQLPRMIVWADGSRAFNSGRADITYSGILTSEGYRVLETGVRPIQLLPQGGSPTADCLMPAFDEACNLEEISATGRPAPPVERLNLPPIYPILPEVESDYPGRDRDGDLDSTGFQPISTRFNPGIYYQEFPRVAGQYDSNYIPFRLDGAQQEATMAIAAFAQSQQIPLVFVNLPLTQDYLDPTRQAYENQFRQHMQQLAAQRGFIFRDLSQQQGLMQNEYFADPSHLNRYGASAVSAQLAADPMIPWADLQPGGINRREEAEGT